MKNCPECNGIKGYVLNEYIWGRGWYEERIQWNG